MPTPGRRITVFHDFGCAFVRLPPGSRPQLFPYRISNYDTMKKPSLLLTLAILSHACFAQLFTRIIPEDASGVYYSHNAWFDFDLDGDLDFIITGAASANNLVTRVYENMGEDIFRPAVEPFNFLPRYTESEIAFLSLNGDDRIDIMLMGRRIGDETTNRISLLQNLETGFVDLGSLPDFGRADGYGTISVGDVNNDAATDIFVSGISGFSNGYPVLSSVLYINNGDSYEKHVDADFLSVYIAASRLADLDNDQDLDLILSGSDGDYPYQVNELYFNDGAGDFQLADTPLQPLQNTSIDVTDYDGDNDLDILFTGLNGQLEQDGRLYANGAGSFTEVTLSDEFDRTASGSARWGDYDNDGDQDILITGVLGSNPLRLALFENDGQGQFTQRVESAFDTLSLGAANWGDYDNDGDLDILVTGASLDEEAMVPNLYILKNGTATKNEAPGVPANFDVIRTGLNACMLQWDAATDDLTPVASLTYNLAIRNADTGAWRYHPLSESNSGKRMVCEQGNVGLNTGWKLQNMEDGVYAMKVQSVDWGFTASGWSGEKVFYAGTPAAPAGLSVSYDGELLLSWTDDSKNEEYFVIERMIDDGTFVKLDSTTANVFTFRDAYEGHSLYRYRVYAVNPNGRSGYSNTAETVLYEPSGLAVDFTGEMALTWSDNSYNEEYFVIERRSEGSDFQTIDSVSANIHVFTEPLVPPGFHEYRVYAANPHQQSARSNTGSILITSAETTSSTRNSLYPNPATDAITITAADGGSRKASVELVAPHGSLSRRDLLLDSDGKVRLDISTVPPGIYVIKLRLAPNLVTSLKFIKR